MTAFIKITVQRAEGPCEADFSLHTFEGADAEHAANAYLRQIACTAPREGGYDKTDVSATLHTGDTIGMRFDVKHYTLADCDCDVRQHLYEFIFYHRYPERIPWVKELPRRRMEETVTRMQEHNRADFVECERILAALAERAA